MQLFATRGLACRELPAELFAASQLTFLVFRDPDVGYLNIAHDTLPRSLQQLRVTEGSREAHSWIPYDDGNVEAAAPCVQRDFAGLIRVQQLQLTVHNWGLQFMPTG